MNVEKRRVYYKDVEFVLYISGGLFCFVFVFWGVFFGGGGDNITQHFMCHIKNIKTIYT